MINRTFPHTFQLALLDKNVGIATLPYAAHHALGEEAGQVEAVRFVKFASAAMS